MMMQTRQSKLISPYGGELVNLLVAEEQAEEVKARAAHLPSLQVSERAVCDLELLAHGAFSPLDRFMGQQDYRRVLEEMRLGNGAISPIPITLPIGRSSEVKLDEEVAVRNARNELLAVMTV